MSVIDYWGIEKGELINIIDNHVDEIIRLRAALTRIADDDVDEDLRGQAPILQGIAWAALEWKEK